MFGSSKCAIFLNDLLKEYPLSVSRKVSCSISEYNSRIKALDSLKNNGDYVFFMNLIPVSTTLVLPDKIETLMRNVKISKRREEIRRRNG